MPVSLRACGTRALIRALHAVFRAGALSLSMIGAVEGAGKGIYLVCNFCLEVPAVQCISARASQNFCHSVAQSGQRPFTCRDCCHFARRCGISIIYPRWPSASSAASCPLCGWAWAVFVQWIAFQAGLLRIQRMGYRGANA